MRLTGCRYARVLVPQDDDSDVFARSSSQGTRDPGARVRQKLFAANLSSTPKGSDRPTSQKKWHWSRDVGSCFSEYQPPTDPTQSAARTSEATLPLSWTKNCTGGTSFFREGSCCEGRCDAVKHAQPAEETAALRVCNGCRETARLERLCAHQRARATPRLRWRAA